MSNILNRLLPRATTAAVPDSALPIGVFKLCQCKEYVIEQWKTACPTCLGGTIHPSAPVPRVAPPQQDNAQRTRVLRQAPAASKNHGGTEVLPMSHGTEVLPTSPAASVARPWGRMIVTVPLSGEVCSIGATQASQVPLPASAAGPMPFQIRRSEGQISLIAHPSISLRVNGQPRSSGVVQPGDVLELGAVQMRIEILS